MGRLLCLIGLHSWRRIGPFRLYGEYYVECRHCARKAAKQSALD